MSPLALVIVLILLGSGGLIAFAAYRWRAGTEELIERLFTDGPTAAPATYSETELEALPEPVERYFRVVLREGQPVVRRARLSQRGDFLLKPGEDGWRPFTAVQHYACGPPGFVWDARIRMTPGLVVRVRDGFVAGTGYMRASLMGMIPVLSLQGTPGIAAGALHRYLAETVWTPTALLPSRGVTWTPLEDSNARATLSAGDITVSLDFRFGPDGTVESVFTPERARDVRGRTVATPWQGRFFEYQEREGMLIPARGEVEWLLPEAPQIYWRGHITDVYYEYEEPADRC